MINTNLLITDALNNAFDEDFGGSAYDRLVAHDNLMSEYTEEDDDGYIVSIPYHAIDAVVITHSSSSHTATDDLCDSGCPSITYTSDGDPVSGTLTISPHTSIALAVLVDGEPIDTETIGAQSSDTSVVSIYPDGDAFEVTNELEEGSSDTSATLTLTIGSCTATLPVVCIGY